MVKSNNLLTLHIVLHEGETTHNLRMTVVASVQFPHMQEAIRERIGKRWPESAKLRLSWLKSDGSVVELSQAAWRDYVFTMWCTQPWVVHAHDDSTRGDAGSVKIPLDRNARILFEKYDINRNGFIERAELQRLLNDVRFERLAELGCDISDALVQRFVEHEFLRLDTDGSGGIELNEFTKYVTNMTPWMRAELMQLSNESALFDHRAGKAVEQVFEPTAMRHDGAEVKVVKTGCFGIRLEVPLGALPNSGQGVGGVRISVRTLSELSVSYLAEESLGKSAFGGARQKLTAGLIRPSSPDSKRKSSFEGFYMTPFSPVVRIDLPAFGGDGAPPELGTEPAASFNEPLTLVIPHCFDSRPNAEFIAMVAGAPHGASSWAPVARDDLDDPRDGIDINGQEMRVSIPHAGTFCAFAKQSAADIVFVCRFHIFALGELSRYKPSGVRVQLCPELPNQIEEMQIEESSHWGLSTCVGASQVLYLPKGVRFRLKFGDAEEEFTWVGLRGKVSFVIPAVGDGGREPPAEDADRRQLFDGGIELEMLGGIGPKARHVKSVARRAGMPAATMTVPFVSRIREVEIAKPPILRLRERTPYDFTVTWKHPAGIDARGKETEIEVTHYQIEIATTAPSGTYYPWQVLWAGAGHECPDPRLLVAQRNGDDAKVAKLTKELEQEHTSEVPKAGLSATAKMQGRSDKPQANKPPPEPVYSYSLPVEPNLFGKLRIRCWAKGEHTPSKSSQVTLPRWNGAPGVDNKLQMVIDERAAHFRGLKQHVSPGFEPVRHRIGNPVSLNKWGGDSPPPPPPPPAREKALGNVMAPVPYDVPRLPKDLDGVEAASEALAHFYRECGVAGGGGGELFGMRIDQVLHAIAGTPTKDGERSPQRTVTGFGEPLMALCECAYQDVLVELFEEAAVLKPQWRLASEKLFNVVGRIGYHREHYALVEPNVKEILNVMVELWEMVRQCGAEDALTFHLQQDYKMGVKKALAAELTARLQQLSTRLSTELLGLQREVRAATRADTGAIETGGEATDPREKLLTPAPPPADGKPKKNLFRSLKRAVSTHGTLSSAFGRAQEKSLARQIDEMMRAADARAAAEEVIRLEMEAAAEESAAILLESAQRGKVARGPRGRIAGLRRQREAKDEAARRAARRAAALEAYEEKQRFDAATKVQAHHKGLMARQQTAWMREERSIFQWRMRKLRFALKAHAAAYKAAMQLKEEAERRREALAEEAKKSESAYLITDERLDILEMTDTSDASPRLVGWAHLREAVRSSEMIPVAMGAAIRPRPLFLEAQPRPQPLLEAAPPSRKPSQPIGIAGAFRRGIKRVT